MTDISGHESPSRLAEDKPVEGSRNETGSRLYQRARFLARAGLTENEALKQAGDELAAQGHLAAVLRERKSRIVLLRRMDILNQASRYKGEEGAFLARLLLGDETLQPGASSVGSLAVPEKSPEKAPPSDQPSPGSVSAASPFPRYAHSHSVYSHSVYSGALMAEADIMGSLLHDLEKAGVLDALKGRDPDFDRDIISELWRLEEPETGPETAAHATAERDRVAATGNDHARKAAEILHLYQESVRRQLNRAGAWIGRAEHYITRHSHDAEKIRGKGTDEDYRTWREMILPKLDEKSFDSLEGPGDLERFLRDIWAALSAGRHEGAGADWLSPESPGTEKPGDTARRRSSVSGGTSLGNRALVFRTADDWLDYNVHYGRGSVVDSAMLGLRHGARNAAIMRVLGPDPLTMVNDVAERLEKGRLVKELQVKEPPEEKAGTSNELAQTGPEESVHGENDEVCKVSGQRAFSEGETLSLVRNGNLLQIITGQLIHPSHQTLAQTGSAMTTSQQLSDFGGIMLASLPDIAIGASVLRQDGMSVLKAWQEELFSRAPSLGGQKSPDDISDNISDNISENTQEKMPDRREVARFLEVGIRGVLGAVIRRFAAPDSPLGVMSRLVSHFHEWGGHEEGKMPYWQDSLVEGTGLMVSHYLGCQAGKNHAGLSPRFQQSLARYAIEAPEWEALRPAVVQAGDEEPYLLAGELYRLNESTLSLLWEPDWTAAGQGTDHAESETVSQMAEDVRHILREKLSFYISDHVRLALTEAPSTSAPATDVTETDATATDATETDDGTGDDIMADKNARSFMQKAGSDSSGPTFSPALREAVQVIRALRIFPLSAPLQDWPSKEPREKADEAGIVHLMVAMTLLSYLALSARAIAEGQKPHNPADWRTVMAAMVQGGGAGLYGDFLSGEQGRGEQGWGEQGWGEQGWGEQGWGEQERKSESFSDNFPPTLGDMARLYHIGENRQAQPSGHDAALSSKKSLKKYLMTLINEAQGRIPGGNLFYTSMALRYLFAHRLQEVVNPGYLQRYERRCEDHQDQQCWLSPSRNDTESFPASTPYNVTNTQ